MKIKVLIIDDEELARSLIKKFLETESDFQVVAEAENGFEGIKLIQSLQPDLLFLDIQMPKLTGFEMLELVETPPAIIFSTAYDEYAVDAFEKNAIDYLLKPFSKERLLKALEKAKEKLANQQASNHEIRNLQTYVENKVSPSGRLVIKNGSKIELIPYQDIYYIEADGDYTKIFAKQGIFLKQKTMKDWEETLTENFIRIHRSFLLNIGHVAKIELYDKNNYRILLQNGTKLEVSKAGYKQLKNVLGW